MQLHIIDILIIGFYIVATVYVGIYLRKRSAKNINSYLLGGNKLPWYMLGLSNASGMFDISGTMWMVYLAFAYGLKSMWIPWLWPVFNQVFMMVFMAMWLRRSNVMTGAEWIRTRFGEGMGAKLSHIVVVVFALVGVVGYLSYGFIGIGKFISIFMPWHIDPNIYGLIFTAITALYVILGGMLGVVVTEVIQFTILTIASFIIGGIALMKVDRDVLLSMVPAGWDNPFFGWNLNMDWSQYIPQLNQRIADDGYSLFAIFFMMMLFKGVLVSLAGPAPNYDMQKVLSTRSPVEAAKMSGSVSLALLLPRYFMITGFTVLAVVFFSDEFRAMGSNMDFEQILPLSINEFVPIGLKGLLIAGLLAAFMGSFAATVNAAPAYIVNDIYLKYVNPDATQKRLIWASYLTSLFVVVFSSILGLYVRNINDVIQWIVSALYGGYTASNVLKWYWWRFNGHGYFWGMAAGIAASLVLPLVFHQTLELYYFPVLLAISLAGCIIGTYMYPPTDEKTLVKFYVRVRPWGFWKPIHNKVMAVDPTFRGNGNFKRDAFNILVGIVWQSCLTIVPIYVIIKEKTPLIISIAILLITTFILKKNWWDKLSEEKEITPEKEEEILSKISPVAVSRPSVVAL